MCKLPGKRTLSLCCQGSTLAATALKLLQKGTTMQKTLVLKRTTLISALLILVMLFTLAFSPLAEASSSKDLSAAKKLVKEYSLYEPTAALLNAKDMKSFINELSKVDSYCYYLTKDEYKELMTSYNPLMLGIGLATEQNEQGQLIVKAIQANTPAAAAGIKRGDIVVSIDGITTAGKDMREIDLIIQSSDEKRITLETMRDGVIYKHTLNWTEMELSSIIYWMEDSETAYIEILQFNMPTAQHMAEALEYLSTQGMKSLIIDLRNCPGGVMDTAAGIAALFIEDGPLFFCVSRFGYDSFLYTTSDDNKKWNMPLAVLVNENSASSSEILAAILQDTARASIIGTGTYGKGIYQSIAELPSGGALYFTTGKYISRGYQDVAASHGLTPDVLVQDEQQQKTTALNWLKKQQALAKSFKFTIGTTNASADGIAFTLNAAPFIENGSTYLPMSATLQKMGWNVYYQGNSWYAENGSRRLVVDIASAKVVSGNRNAQVIVRNNTVFLPASFFTNLGYTITWDGNTSSVILNK